MFLVNVTSFLLFLTQEVATHFVGYPATNWIESSQACSKVPLGDVNISDMRNVAELLKIDKTNRVWTGSRVTYSKWTSFIGCFNSFPSDDDRTALSFNECNLHCSGEDVLYFAYKNKICVCLNEKPNIGTNHSDCRQKCPNNSEFVCGRIDSGMVFKYVKVEELKLSNTFIVHECLARDAFKSEEYFVKDCNENLGDTCSKSAKDEQLTNWFDFQNSCIAYGNLETSGKRKEYIGSYNWYWTHIFRIHVILQDRPKRKENCIGISVNSTGTYIAENCTTKLPFLCSKTSTGSNKPDPMDENMNFSKHLESYFIHFVITLSAGVFSILLLVIGCLIYRYKLKQALYTKFLYTQVQEKSNPDPTYELIFEKDLDSICHFKKDIYAEPFTNSVRTNRTRDLTEDEAGYLTPNNYFNGSALFWQKVLANAKPSEVRKVFDQKRISHGTRKSVVYAVPKQEVTWHVHVADIHTASSSNV